MKQQPTIETARLILRPFGLPDAKEVQRLAGDRAIADTTLNIPHPYENGMAEQWISTHKSRFKEGELVNFAIVLRNPKTLMGAIGLQMARRFDRAELGYWVGMRYWNKGYCTEAGQAVLKYAFTELDLNRIHAAHFERNPASGRVMEKLGMINEGIARQHVKKWNKFEDLVQYGILKTDWQKNREPSTGANP